MKLNSIIKLALPAVATVACAAAHAQAPQTIKVGVLHSLSGTMAISETTLKDTVLMLIDEQNKKGGVLGKKLPISTVPTTPATGACTPMAFKTVILLKLRAALMA